LSNLLFEEETYKISKACFNVYNKMGCGFLEAVYQECLEYEFEEQLIELEAQKELKLYYFDRELKQTYIPNFICNRNIIVEIKAVKEFAPIHEAQVFNYLKATGFKVGILVNFGSFPNVIFERICH